MLTVLLLFVGTTSLSGMIPGAPPPAQQNSISEAIFRDILHGGLIAPALLAEGIIVFGTNKVSDNSIDLMKQVLVGYSALAIPIVMKCFGYIFDVEKGNPTSSAAVWRNGFRCTYAFLIILALFNSEFLIDKLV